MLTTVTAITYNAHLTKACCRPIYNLCWNRSKTSATYNVHK